jgi:hypothetical protein
VMHVLVDTNQLSEVAAAEVEAIAHMRREQHRKKFASVRAANKDKKMSYPAPGAGDKYRRTESGNVSDGVKNKDVLPGEAPLVAGETGDISDGERDDRGSTGETAPGPQAPGKRRR